jgi:tetratricopeptide (TPR) repeat protein
VLVLTLVGLAPTGPTPAMAQASDADVYVAEAVLALDDKQWDKALGLLQQALAKEPDHLEALYYIGVAYMGKRQPANAVPILPRARAKSPGESSVAYQLGLAYISLEQPERAGPLLEEILAHEPALDSLGSDVGFRRYRAGRDQDALAAFKAARQKSAARAEPVDDEDEATEITQCREPGPGPSCFDVVEQPHQHHARARGAGGGQPQALGVGHRAIVEAVHEHEPGADPAGHALGRQRFQQAGHRRRGRRQQSGSPRRVGQRLARGGVEQVAVGLQERAHDLRLVHHAAADIAPGVVAGEEEAQHLGRRRVAAQA